MSTLKDVASLAGVSIATVSRALMSPERVSFVTREKIENAVVECGYLDRKTWRKNKKQNTGSIMIIVPDLHDAYFTEVIEGIKQVINHHSYLTIISDHKQHKGRARDRLCRQVDGILILGSDRPSWLNDPYVKTIPSVIIGEYASQVSLPCVHTDALTATYEAVNYLIKLGHRQIAQIGGPADQPQYEIKTKGYQGALKRASIRLSQSYITHGENTFESGFQIAGRLLSSHPIPSGLFCHTDTIAIGAISRAKQMGFRVPQDVSIIGFDDIQISQYCDPPLTTISQPKQGIGAHAAGLLFQIINGETLLQHSHLLETHLVVRESVAPPYVIT